MIAIHKAKYLVGWGWTRVCFLAHRGSTGGLLLLQFLRGSPVSQRVVTTECLSLLHHSFFIDSNCYP